MKFLKNNFDVAHYVYPEHARNRMASLLNMSMQKIYYKRTRYFLKYVMEHSYINCLFYKVYTNSSLMEKVRTRIKMCTNNLIS